MANNPVVELLLRAKDEASKVIAGVAGKVEDLRDSFNKLDLATAGFGAAIAGWVYTMKSFINSANEARLAQIKLVQALKSVGEYSDANMQALNAQADALSKVAGQSTESILSAQALLATYKLTTAQILQLTPAISNMAAIMNMDVSSAAMLVGRSLNMGLGALRRFGISVDEATQKHFLHATATERVIMMNELLNQKFRDGAETIGRTYPGAMARLNVAFEQVKETIGGILVNILTPIINKLSTVVFWFSSLPAPVRLAAIAVGVLGSATLILVPALYGLGLALWPIITGMGALVVSMLPLIGTVAAVAVGITSMGYLAIGTANAFLGAWTALKTGIMTILGDLMDAFIGYAEMWRGILTFDPKMALEGLKTMKNSIVKALADTGGAMADQIVAWGDCFDQANKTVVAKAQALMTNLQGAMSNQAPSGGSPNAAPIPAELGAGNGLGGTLTAEEANKMQGDIAALMKKNVLTQQQASNLSAQIGDKTTKAMAASVQARINLMKQEYEAKKAILNMMAQVGYQAGAALIQQEYSKVNTLSEAGKLAEKVLKANAGAMIKVLADHYASQLMIYGAGEAGKALAMFGGFPFGLAAAAATLAFYGGLASMVSAAGGVAAAKLSPPSGGGGGAPPPMAPPPAIDAGAYDKSSGTAAGSGTDTYSTASGNSVAAAPAEPKNVISINIYGDNYNDPLMGQKIARIIAEEQALSSN